MAAPPSCFLAKAQLFIYFNEPSSLGFVALATNPANPAKTQLLMF